jgi:molecular chaperone DnaJ
MTCPECKGRGRIPATTRGSARVERACPRCDGAGVVSAPPCSRCGGSGQVAERETVEVKIPPGIRDGQKLRLAGLGAPGQMGGPAGDLYVRVTVAPHPVFRREGDDLHVDVPVTVREAVSGATIEVETPSGRVSLKVPPGTQSGRKLRLRGLGAAGKEGKGDLIARIVVHAPDAESPELRDLVAKLDRFYEADVRRDLKV